ncbi:MAG: hypothetical protein ACM3TT_09105 [Syntrophothermus sp.]
MPGAEGRLEAEGWLNESKGRAKDWRPACLATGIGSLPHRDPVRASEIVLDNFPEIPFWPQLPKRDSRESMYAMYSEGLPGVVLASEGRVYVDTTLDLLPGVEEIFSRALAGKVEEFAISPDYAAGFFAFEEALRNAVSVGDRGIKRWTRGTRPEMIAVKGQVTGPISFGFQVADENRRPLFYHELMSEAVVQLLKFKARWQEERLKRLAGAGGGGSHAIGTVIFIDEPYLASYGSAFVSLNREDATRVVGEVMDGLSGLKGVHCCGNTEWEMLLETPLDILSFDAFNYAENLALYAGRIKDFLTRGGVLAWGIVPTIAEDLETHTVESLTERLEAGMRRLAEKGVSWDDLLASALITPSCGLGTQDESTAERALALTAGVSRAMRAKYRL